MAYKLTPQTGDTTAIPQLVMAHLARTDGDTIRVALYILQTGETDPRGLAKTLGLKSIEAAKRALQYWAGAGLLHKERAMPVPEAQTKTEQEKLAEIDLSSLQDPRVAFLCEEAQNMLGKPLSRNELLRLVSLYLNDGWQPDVVLLCCGEVVRQGRHTVAAVSRELDRWREAGVETGEDADQYLQRQQKREDWWVEAAKLFDMDPAALTRWERGAIVRWHEEWAFTAAMIEEALLHAEGKRTVRYVDGILRSWHAQGLTTVAAVRGNGQLVGSNILATRKRGGQNGQAAAKTPSGTPQHSWNSIVRQDLEQFMKELEGTNDAYEG